MAQYVSRRKKFAADINHYIPVAETWSRFIQFVEQDTSTFPKVSLDRFNSEHRTLRPMIEQLPTPDSLHAFAVTYGYQLDMEHESLYYLTIMDHNERNSFLRSTNFNFRIESDSDCRTVMSLKRLIEREPTVASIWLQSDGSRKLINLDKMLYDENRVSLGRPFVGCRSLGEVLILSKTILRLHILSNFVRVWSFLTLANERRNRVLKYFYEHFHRGEFQNRRLLTDGDVRSVGQLITWSHSMLAAARRAGIIEEMKLVFTFAATLCDLIQVETDSEWQRQSRLKQPRLKQLNSIDILLTMNQTLREDVLKDLGLKPSSILNLKTLDQVTRLLSSVADLSELEFNQELEVFWRYKEPKSGRETLLKKLKELTNRDKKLESSFERIASISMLLKWATDYNIVTLLKGYFGILKRRSPQNEHAVSMFDNIRKVVREKLAWEDIIRKKKKEEAALAREKEAAKLAKKAAELAEAAAAEKEQNQDSQGETSAPQDVPPSLSSADQQPSERAAEAINQDSSGPADIDAAEKDSGSLPETSEQDQQASGQESTAETKNIDHEEDDQNVMHTPSAPVINESTHCYMIAVFQALTHLPEFMNAPSCTRLETCLLCHLRRLAHKSLEGEIISSNEFWETRAHWRAAGLKRLPPSSEHDSCEFFLAMLDECSNEIDNIFTMSTVRILRCLKCKKLFSKHVNDGYCLNVPTVSTDCNEPDYNYYAAVSDLIDASEEVLTLPSSCLHCGNTRCAVQMRTENPGKIFMVELSRSTDTNEGNKKIYVDQTQTVGGQLYFIHAVLVYIPFGSGHYVSYVSISGTWWRMDGVEMHEADSIAINEDSNVVKMVIYRRGSTHSGAHLRLHTRKVSIGRKSKKSRGDIPEYVELREEIENTDTLKKLDKKEIDQTNWQTFNDLGVAVITNDAKTGRLLRAQIIADIAHEVDPEGTLEEFIYSNKVTPFAGSNEELSAKLIKDYRLVSAVSEFTHSDSFDRNKRMATQCLRDWNTGKGEQSRLAQLESFLKIFKELYTAYSSYKWPEAVVKLCKEHEIIFSNLFLANLDQAEKLLILLMAHKEIATAIKYDILLRVVQIEIIPMDKLIDYLVENHDDDKRRELQTFAREVNIIRNHVVHHYDDHKFASQEEKNNFFEHFTNFVDAFPFHDCFPLADEDSMKKEFHDTKVNYALYSDILDAYSTLYAHYEAAHGQLDITKNETDGCMTALSRCYEDVRCEKDIIDDHTYF